tara:strand:- start:52 stop:201 length:150 start_codon:yes stop_codon:yes gene_type:complete
MKNKRTNQNLSLTEKIENAEKRIIELKALIKHWKKKLNRTMDNTGAEIK